MMNDRTKVLQIASEQGGRTAEIITVGALAWIHGGWPYVGAYVALAFVVTALWAWWGLRTTVAVPVAVELCRCGEPISLPPRGRCPSSAPGKASRDSRSGILYHP